MLLPEEPLLGGLLIAIGLVMMGAIVVVVVVDVDVVGAATTVTIRLPIVRTQKVDTFITYVVLYNKNRYIILICLIFYFLSYLNMTSPTNPSGGIH